jgi:pilus assembly protein Flp/PilA
MVKIIRASLLPILDNDTGVTAIEYGLIAALVAVVCIVVWSMLGTNMSGVFSTIASSI